MNDFTAPPSKPTLRGMKKTLHGSRAEPHFAAIRLALGKRLGDVASKLWIEPTFRLVPNGNEGVILQVPTPYAAEWYLKPTTWDALAEVASEVLEGRHLAIAVVATDEGFRVPTFGLVHQHWQTIHDAFNAATGEGWRLEGLHFMPTGNAVKLYCGSRMLAEGLKAHQSALHEAVKLIFGPEAELDIVIGHGGPQGPKNVLLFDPHVAKRVAENGGNYQGLKGAEAVDAATRDVLAQNTDKALERAITEKNRRFSVTGNQFLKDVPKLLDHERGELAVKIILRAVVEADSASGKARFDVGNLAKDYKTDPSHIRKAVKLIENYRLARVERGYGGFDLAFHPLDVFKQPGANLATEVSRFERESQEKGLPSAKRA